MDIVELNERHRDQLIDLIRTSTVRHVLPCLDPLGQAHYLSKLIPDIDYCYASESGRYVGIFKNENLIGVCGFSAKGHIAQLFVQTSEQSKGLGTMLLNYAMSQCEASTITVNASPNAVSYYRQRGFDSAAAEQNVGGVRYVPMAKKNS